MTQFIRYFQEPRPIATESGSPRDGYTGEPCQMGGVYDSACMHAHSLCIQKGQRFPDCCGSEPRGTYWFRKGDA